MGDYSVPESIRKFKPKGTMVKAISGNYYVYEYSSYKDENGKRKTKMGHLIGSIKEGIGFIPNDSYIISSEISTLEYGQYAITLSNSSSVLKLLKECFNPLDAVRIYVVSVIHFIENFTYLKDVSKYYEMSYLSLKFPGLKMGYTALSTLYDSLGRRQSGVLKFEQTLASDSSREMAIDGHAIACSSDENDLAEKGSKFNVFNSDQINLLMAYDVNTGIPLISKIYEGGNLDKISVRDFLTQIVLENMLFIVDSGFYSTENIELFSQNNNSYIIPLSSNLRNYRCVTVVTDVNGRFIYRANRKNSVIEYKKIDYEGYTVIAYKDMSLAALSESDFLCRVEEGKWPAYTMERYNELKDSFGLIVLQTNLKDKSEKEIYELYKKRWRIETYYDYFKNNANYKALHLSDYYKTQGLSFIMLVSSLIYREVNNAVLKLKTRHVEDCLLDARMIKIHKRSGKWSICNCKNTSKEMFNELNTDLTV